MSRLTAKERRETLEAAGGRCAKCGIDVVALAAMNKGFLQKVLPKGAAPYEIDHKVPFSESGDNSLQNLQVLCGNCHRDKCDGERPEYARGERSHTLDRVQPKAGAKGLSSGHAGLRRALGRRLTATWSA